MHMCKLRGHFFTLALDWCGAGDWIEADAGKSRVVWEPGTAKARISFPPGSTGLPLLVI